jgi:hypothetical protein
MRLLQLFEQLDRLDEAAIDRYLPMFEGIFVVLQQMQTPGFDLDPRVRATLNKAKEMILTHAPKSYGEHGDDPVEIESQLGSLRMDPSVEDIDGLFDQIIALQRDMIPIVANAAVDHHHSATVRRQTHHHQQNITAEIKWAIEVLKRSDRITWYLRYYKLGVLLSIRKMGLPDAIKTQVVRIFEKDKIKLIRIISGYAEQLQQSIEALDKRIQKLRGRTNTGAGNDSSEADILDARQRVLSRIMRNDSTVDFDSHNEYIDMMKGMHDRLQHSMQMASMIPAIDEIQLDKQTPRGLLWEYRQIEDEWQDKMGRFVGDNEVPENAETIIEFSDGSRWVNLNKRECDIEARSMGHCGNVQWGNPDDMILSYRQPLTNPQTGKTGWIPRLTFILDKSDGMLGEMKGFKNQQPSSKYHPQIVELLKHDMIKGIKGGGYSPENNFAMHHLDAAVAEELIELKPSFATVSNEFYANDQEMTQSVFNKINSLISNFHYLHELDSFDKNTIVVDKAGTVEDIYNDYGDGYDDGQWYHATDDDVESTIGFLSSEIVDQIRNYTVQSYLRREPASNISPEILTELKNADAHELFSMLEEHDDELYDAIGESIKKSYGNSVAGELESYVQYSYNYSIGDSAASAEFVHVGQNEDGESIYQLQSGATDFVDNVVPMLERGENDNSYNDASWVSVLGLHLPESSMDIDNDAMLEYAAELFETHEDVKKAIRSIQPSTKNTSQMELNL